MIHLVRLKMDKFLIGVVNECFMSNWWSWKNSHRSIGEARGLLSTSMCCNCDGPLVLLLEERQKRAKVTIFLVRHFDLTFG
jgi:hypothetical protein